MIGKDGPDKSRENPLLEYVHDEKWKHADEIMIELLKRALHYGHRKFGEHAAEHLNNGWVAQATPELRDQLSGAGLFATSLPGSGRIFLDSVAVKVVHRAVELLLAAPAGHLILLVPARFQITGVRPKIFATAKGCTDSRPLRACI